jgi:type II secretory pathway pseudopilin PulG
MLAMTWIAGSTLLELVVVGSLVGLILAVLALLLIWWIEWRQGRIW